MAFNIDNLLETKIQSVEEDVEEFGDEEDDERDEDDEKANAGGWNNLANSQLAMYAIANDLRTPTLVELQMLLGVSGK